MAVHRSEELFPLPGLQLVVIAFLSLQVRQSIQQPAVVSLIMIVREDTTQLKLGGTPQVLKATNTILL